MNKPIANAIILAGCALISTALHAANFISELGLWSYDEDIVVSTPFDPEDPDDTTLIELKANIFLPSTTVPGQTFPAIIFVNSWSSNEHQNTDQAKMFADHGYIVLRYTTRGFRGAPAFIDTAGNKDVADAGNAIRYLIENTPVDESKIALAGTSYGSGISLNTALRDERVAAVIATSTWGSLRESLWPTETPKEDWINILIAGSNRPIGHRDPEILTNLDNMHQHKNIEETIAWAMERSPLSYLEQANLRERKPAIYVANNLHDYLFHPNSIIELLENYQGPWHADFSFGTHGQGESDYGDSPLDNYAWQNAYAWVNHYLQGEKNYINDIDRVSTRVKSSTGQLRDSFPRLPVHEDIIRFYADPIPGAQGGELNLTGTWNADTPSIDSAHDKVWTGGLAGAVMMSSWYFRLENIDPLGALVFKSPVLEKDLFLRGAPVLNFFAQVKHNIQYFGYLLDYDPAMNIAHWVGHGPFTWHRSADQTDDPAEPQSVQLEMFWTAHDLAAGHQLILVIDGADSEYYAYADSPKEHQFVINSEHPVQLDIPVIYSRPILDSIERRAAIAAAEATANDAGTSRGSGGNGTSYGPGGGSLDGWLSAVAMILLGRRRSSTSGSFRGPRAKQPDGVAAIPAVFPD